MLNGKHMPFWLDSTKRTEFSPMSQETVVDVTIVGGGIAGLSTAFMLKKQGLKVAVAESNRIVGDVTAGTTAKITVTSSLIYNTLLSKFGRKFALKFYKANCDAFDTIPKIINELNIDCDYRHSPLYIYASNKENFANIDDEFAVLNELGIPAKAIDDLPYPFSGIHGILYENQAEFHPKKYLNELANFIDGEGSFVFEKTRVLSVEDVKKEDINEKIKTNDKFDLKRVVTDKGDILSNFVVVATNVPIYDPDSVCNFTYQNKSYVMGVYTRKKQPFGMFVDINPFHSYRSTPTEKGELFIVGGEHHNIGEMEDTWECFKRLNNHIEDVFDSTDIEYFWSNQDNRTEDGFPIIGETSHNNVYIATGFNSWGMTAGTLASNVISYLILEKLGKTKNILESLPKIGEYYNIFDSQRFKDKESSKDIKKCIKTFYEDQGIEFDSELSYNVPQNIYYKGNLTEEESKLLSEYLMKIHHDEAKIVDIGDKSIAIYKDSNSNIYAVSSISTHSGCELAWNTAEKAWECPEFGSRFSYNGKVIHGPAVYDLKSYLY